jgi:hypothetical protein
MKRKSKEEQAVTQIKIYKNMLLKNKEELTWQTSGANTGQQATTIKTISWFSGFPIKSGRVFSEFYQKAKIGKGCWQRWLACLLACSLACLRRLWKSGRWQCLLACLLAALLAGVACGNVDGGSACLLAC